jgi:hypothetical protein
MVVVLSPWFKVSDGWTGELKSADWIHGSASKRTSSAELVRRTLQCVSLNVSKQSAFSGLNANKTQKG